MHILLKSDIKTEYLNSCRSSHFVLTLTNHHKISQIELQNFPHMDKTAPNQCNTKGLKSHRLRRWANINSALGRVFACRINFYSAGIDLSL